MPQNQSQKSLGNVCLFCGDKLNSPSMCTFCGFKFCEEHKATDHHQCIKTRYMEYVRKSPQHPSPNIIIGRFRVVCEMCGFNTAKGVPIEYAGEELTQHTQIVGCSKNVFLDEVKDNLAGTPKKEQTDSPSKTDSTQSGPENTNSQTSIVDQILKVAELKEKQMISEEEFQRIKQELIKKLQS